MAALMIGGVLVVGGIGWGLGVLADQSSPASLRKPAAAEYAAVHQVQFRDPQDVTVEVISATTVSVTSTVAGTVTSSTCAPGSPVTSGESLISIDGEPLISLATSVPFWRDLVAGDKGPDVVAIQTELSRLGYDVRQDGVLGSETLAAVAALRGVASQPSLPRSQFLWIPVDGVRASKCGAGRGTHVDAAAALLDVEAALPSIRVTDLPKQAIAGERELTIDGAVYPVSADQAVQDPVRQRELLESSAYQEAKKEEGRARIAAVATLASPVGVSSVPPSSVVGGKEGATCVVTRGGVVPATIVGSQLGQTFLSFGAEAPKDVQITPARDTPCR